MGWCGGMLCYAGRQSDEMVESTVKVIRLGKRMVDFIVAEVSFMNGNKVKGIWLGKESGCNCGVHVHATESKCLVWLWIWICKFSWSSSSTAKGENICYGFPENVITEWLNVMISGCREDHTVSIGNSRTEGHNWPFPTTAHIPSFCCFCFAFDSSSTCAWCSAVAWSAIWEATKNDPNTSLSPSLLTRNH